MDDIYRHIDMEQTDRWIDHLRSLNRKENTLCTHRNNVRRCLLYLHEGGRTTDVSRLTTDDVLYLWRVLPVKEEVRRAYLRSLAGLTVFVTGVDVVKGANLLHNRESRTRVFITDGEFTTVYAAADPFQRVVLCLGAYMGLRRGEMQSIRDVDIREGVMRIHGKGHGEEGLVAYARIPEPVEEAIREYRASPMKSGMRDDDYLLQTRGREGRVHRVNLSRVSDSVTELGRRTGVRITTHSLRRYFATTLYDETNCDLQTVRKLMRHADVSTTLKCYVDAYDERERAACERLTEYILDLVTGLDDEDENGLCNE